MQCNRKVLGILTAAILLLVAVAIALVLVLVVFREDVVKVKTPNAGTILGSTSILKDGDTKIQEFHNIRYADPPVGMLRFRPPVRHFEEDPENEVLATDSTEIKCVQATSGEGAEDCLFLTVRSGDLNASKPVLVWIHGGGLSFGHGTSPGYSFDSEVTHKVDAVTVNINYRLGFLGFSSVKELWDEDEGVYANNGIRDMIAALDWIQDNIAAFGGDPGSVTLIGESGGATAVLALTCSPLANNKYHAVISQSPAPEMRFTHVDGDVHQRTIVDQLDCTQEAAADRKQCLLELPAEKFSGKYLDIMSGLGYFTFPLLLGEKAEVVGLVVIDPVVVTVSPRNLSSGDFTPSSPLPIIVSNLAEENWQSDWELNPPFTSKADLRTKLNPLFKNLSDEPNVTDEVIALYPNQDPVSIWSLMTCDMRSTCPTNSVAEAMSAAPHRDIYRLYITHRSSLGVPAFHGYDSIVFFGYKSEMFVARELDTKFEKHYIDMVKKLAKENTFEDGWMTFPGKSMIYENSDEISKISSSKPQQIVCEKLSELNLVKYGWQNK
ncbi:carboxylesterase 1D-like [Bolinopsis microptera]|uniref:carboxylesterase 1D-like n=1 Tax=Bolinopsis microptera TaxID=2820187 RepID=UPI00307AE519